MRLAKSQLNQPLHFFLETVLLSFAKGELGMDLLGSSYKLLQYSPNHLHKFK